MRGIFLTFKGVFHVRILDVVWLKQYKYFLFSHTGLNIVLNPACHVSYII